MGDDGFVYVLSPAVSTRDCVQHVLKENLPSLGEAVQYGEGRKGMLLIARDLFFNDALLSFNQVTGEFSSTSKEKSVPGGAILPKVVAPAGRTSLAAVPLLFKERPWPQVWAQFVRDITRENLLIDDIPCDNPLVALQKIESLLSDAYSSMPSYFVGDTTRKLTEFFGSRVFGLPIVNLTRFALKPLETAYCEMSKTHNLTEAIRLAILTAQQTVLALPVELLQAQFSKPLNDECGVSNKSQEMRMICIGESRATRVSGVESSTLLSSEEGQKMIVRIGRRKEGSRLPFVRVEKALSAFTVDESANRTTHLLLLIEVELSLFTKDHVELRWGWRPP